MRTIEEINETITNWEGDFEHLVKKFNNNDYNTMLCETNWEVIADEYMDEIYQNGEWADFMKFYLEEWLHAQLTYGVKYGTENLMRLWLETV
jgi:hypothetical protein